MEEDRVATIDPGPDKVIGPATISTPLPKRSAWFSCRSCERPVSFSSASPIAFVFVNLFLVAITWLFARGVGVWGIVIPVAWGFAIVNFVWWIGIGHAGTLISAILLLLKQTGEHPSTVSPKP